MRNFFGFKSHFLKFLVVFFVVAVFSSSEVLAQGCNADALIGTGPALGVISDFCTSPGPGECPAGYDCCLLEFDDRIITDIDSAICVSPTVPADLQGVTMRVAGGTFESWGWSYNRNGLRWNTGISKCNNGSNTPATNPTNEPNFEACPPGHSVYGISFSMISQSYLGEFRCALAQTTYQGDANDVGPCCAQRGSDCNITDPSAGPLGLYPCCFSPTQTCYQDPASSSGRCGVCAPDMSDNNSDPGEVCSSVGDPVGDPENYYIDNTLCCGADIICSPSTDTCYTRPPPPTQCADGSGNLPPGEICRHIVDTSLDFCNLCASQGYDADPTCVYYPDPSRCDLVCRGLPVGGDCSFGGDCACTPPNVCDGTGTCAAPGSCQAAGDLCNSARPPGDPQSCCSGLDCEPNPSLPGTEYCVSNCSSVAGTPCDTAPECCSGFSCAPPGIGGTYGTCQPLSGGTTPCSDLGACGFIGGACDYNQRCMSPGYCQDDPTCAGTVGVIDYMGPVIRDFGDLLARIFNLLYPVGIFIGLFSIGKAGYGLMTSEGNPQRVKAAQEELTSAILGTFFIMLSIVIIRVIIGSILGATVNF